MIEKIKRKKATRVLISNQKKMLVKSKRSITPVVATVLLIIIVIVLATIIFLWARGFIKEVVQKKGMPAEQACEGVSLDMCYNGDELQISNVGNIPVYRFEIKKKSQGATDIETTDTGLNAGESDSFSIGSYDEVEVFPAILGEAKTSKKIYTCKNSFIAETC